MRLSYATLYRALMSRSLPHDAERLVLWRLEWGSWFDWEPQTRLRMTVVERFVAGPLDPSEFARLADDGGMAFALIDEAARSTRGRRYLADVRKALKQMSEKGSKAKADYIATKIK